MKINKAFVFLFLIVFNLGAFAQWQQKASGVTHDLLDVKFLNDTLGFACGVDGILKTTDGGDTWSFVQVHSTLAYPGDSLYYALSVLESLSFISDQVGYAGGWYLSNYNQIIFKTTDGGITWHRFYNGGNYNTRFNDIFYVSSLTAYAVDGVSKSFLKSNNGGMTWGTMLTTTTSLLSVYFLDSLRGFIGGNQIFARTSDGGLSWQNISTKYNVGEINFTDKLNGYAGAFNAVLTTTDGGVTWKEIAVSPSFRGVYVTNADSIHLGSVSFLLSIDGDSIYEEQQTPPPLGHLINRMAFANHQVGVVVGDGGLIMKTGNAGGLTKAKAKFDISSSTLCVDNAVQFLNRGARSNSYAWYIDNVLKSNTYSFQNTFSAAGNYSVKLISSNGHSTDTSVKTVVVYPAPTITLSSDKTLCKGSMYQLSASGGQSYSWSPNQGLSSYTISSPVFTGNSSVDYTVTVTSSNQCTASGIVKLQVTLDSIKVVDNWKEVLIPAENYSIADFDFIAPDTGFAVNQHGALLKTTNGGQTWVKSYQGNIFGCDAVDFINADTGFVSFYHDLQRIVKGGTVANQGGWSGSEGIKSLCAVSGHEAFFIVNASYKSIIHWYYDSKGLPSESGGSDLFTKITCLNKDTCFCSGKEYLTNLPFLYKTFNNGVSWVKQYMPGKISAVFFKDKLHGYCGGFGSIYKTTNGGVTWDSVLVNDNKEEIRDIYFTSSDTGYAVSATAWYKTESGGDCWSKYSLVPGVQYFHVQKLSFPNSKVGYTGLVYNTNKIYKTVTGTHAEFYIKKNNVCEIDTLTILNKSYGYLSYDWYINNALYQHNGDFKFKGNPGIYTIKLKCVKDSVIDSVYTTVTIHPTPQVQISTKHLYGICNNDSVKLYVVGADPAHKYNWRNYIGGASLRWDSVLYVKLPLKCYVIDSSQFGCYNVSNYLTVSPGNYISFINQPANVLVCDKSMAQFNVSVDYPASKYEWQVFDTVSGKWLGLNNTPPYSHVDSTDLIISQTPLNLNNTLYRCKVWGACFNDSIYSYQGKLQVSVCNGVQNTHLIQDNFQLWPNPFVNEITISYSLSNFGHVCLEMYNSTGALVKRLVSEEQIPGVYKINYALDPKTQAGGVYTFKFVTDGGVSIKKAVLIQ